MASGLIRAALLVVFFLTCSAVAEASVSGFVLRSHSVASDAPPTLNSPVHSSETGTTAVLGGTISDSGGSAIAGCGAVFSLTSDNPDPQQGGTNVTTTVLAGTCSGFFSITAMNLMPGRDYTFKAFATNASGIGYTVAATFTTPDNTTPTPPAVYNPLPSQITTTTVNLAAQILQDGAGTISERGFIYIPTATNQDPVLTTPGVVRVIEGQTAAGLYNISFAGLQPLTTYSFKGYAINGTGPGYSSVRTFTTLAAAPTVTTPTQTNVTTTSATLGGNVTAAGSTSVTERGVVFTPASQTCTPVIGSATKVAAQTAGLGVFTVNATGLAAATTYCYRAYAINSAGAGYSTPSSFTTANNGAVNCSGGAIYRNTSRTWGNIPGAAKQVSANTNGSGTVVMAIGTNSVSGGCGIYSYIGPPSYWQAVAGAATQVIVGAGGDPWAIQGWNNNAIFKMSGGVWQSIPGAALDLSAGAGGETWAVSITAATGGHLLYRYIGAPNYWQAVPGAAEHLAVAPDNSVWAVQGNGDIYRYSAGSWASIPGKAQQISVGYDGTVYALGTTATTGGFVMYRYVGAPSYWQPIAGGALQVVGAGPGELWAHQ